MIKVMITKNSFQQRFTGSFVLKRLFFLLLIFVGSFSVQAQTAESKGKIDKEKLTIKPNSREVNVSYRGNEMQRLHKFRKPNLIIKQHFKKKNMDNRRFDKDNSKRLDKKNINQNRQELMQRRKQMIQQRRALRK